MRSVFGLFGRMSRIDRANRNRTARPHRPDARVECLETRDLMTAMVAQMGAAVSVTPASTGPSTTLVSYVQHAGVTMLDVNLNGQDHYFSASQIKFVFYWGSGSSGAQTFEDATSLNVSAFGGSGTNVFQGGAGQDDFYGGSGSNTFDAGSGCDQLVGGNGPNVFNENVTGSGEILKVGAQNTINVPPDAVGAYTIY